MEKIMINCIVVSVNNVEFVFIDADAAHEFANCASEDGAEVILYFDAR